MQDGQQRHLVVAGNGMVGQRLVEAMRDRDTRSTWRVTVLSEEPRRAYDRVALSSYFDGAAAADLDLVAEGCYDTGGYDAAPGRGGHRHRPRRAHRHHQPRPQPRLRRAGAGHRLLPVRPAGARPGPARLFRLPHPRRPRRYPGGRDPCGRTHRGGRAWWSEAGCSAWRRPARCACSACPRTSWSWPRG